MLRSSRARRTLAVIMGILFLIGGLVFVKFAQISKLIAMGKEFERAGPPPEAVGSVAVKAESWERTLSAVGTVAGVKGVALSNDAPGRVTRVLFDSGDVVKKGQILVELDSSVERAQLASAKARRDLAELTAKRTRALLARSAIAPAQVDNDEAQLAAGNTEVAAVQAAIERKLIRAPFDGRLGIRQVDVGQYLNPGTTVTMLESSEGVFVDFALPQQRHGDVDVGMPVRIVDSDPRAVAEGVISAVEPKLDDVTRSLKLRASLPNESDHLRPGMFVSVSVVMPARHEVVMLPATAIVHASYGDSVFVIEPKPAGSPGADRTPDGKPVEIARQQFVRLGESRGDYVAVVEGVKAGQRVVSAGAFKLRNGAPVVVDNTLQPRPEINPRPENR